MRGIIFSEAEAAAISELCTDSGITCSVTKIEQGVLVFIKVEKQLLPLLAANSDPFKITYTFCVPHDLEDRDEPYELDEGDKPLI